MKNSQNAKCLLDKTIQEIQSVLDAWTTSPLQFTSERELFNILNTLKKMRCSIDNDQLVEVPGLWRIVIDTWPHTNDLRHKIVEAEYAYEKLM